MMIHIQRQLDFEEKLIAAKCLGLDPDKLLQFVYETIKITDWDRLDLLDFIIQQTKQGNFDLDKALTSIT